jgi:UDP-GlcNAc:undecaprenyl-phosphate/decaprenyl-phosphate GlcNAc-1-phosphate transferase
MLLNGTLLFPVALAAVGFMATFFAIPHLAQVASRYGLVDQPSFRKIHDSPTPLCGGIAIFIPAAGALLLCTGLSYFHYLRLGPTTTQLATLLIACAWMLLLGIVDDKQQLSWKQKLLGQCTGILLLIMGGHSVRSATVPFFGPVDFGWTGPLVFGLAVLAVTNAINLIDGLDGLAAGICFFASLVYGIVGLYKGDVFACAMGFVLSGSLLGFLPFNFPPARVFLGDAGSLMLGFLLGTLATSYAASQYVGQRSATFGVMLAPFLPFGIALLDVALAIIRRWIRGGHIFLPDSDHLHHRLLAEFKNPRVAVGVIYAISLLFAALSVMVTLTPDRAFSLSHYGLFIACAVVLSAIILISYRVDHLSQVLIDRPAFQFLDAYRNFMSVRVLRSKTEEELIGLLQSGVRDLQFDSVEVSRNGNGPVAHWRRPTKAHVGAPRVIIKKDLEDFGLSIRATLPTHENEAYQKYLESVWMDALNFFAVAYSRTMRPCSPTQRHHAGDHVEVIRLAQK